MRTDPRAAEVRAIVKRVFARFLGEKDCFEQSASCAADETREAHGGRYINRRAVHSVSGSRATNDLAALPQPAFPRLYEPDCESDEGTEDVKKLPGHRFGRRASRSGPAVSGRDSFAAGQAPSDMQSPEIDETVLIERGRCVARTYRAAGLMAMWLLAVGIVQFYDDQGRMLGTVNLFRTLRPERMAS